MNKMFGHTQVHKISGIILINDPDSDPDPGSGFRSGSRIRFRSFERLHQINWLTFDEILFRIHIAGQGRLHQISLMIRIQDPDSDSDSGLVFIQCPRQLLAEVWNLWLLLLCMSLYESWHQTCQHMVYDIGDDDFVNNSICNFLHGNHQYKYSPPPKTSTQ